MCGPLGGRAARFPGQLTQGRAKRNHARVHRRGERGARERSTCFSGGHPRLVETRVARDRISNIRYVDSVGIAGEDEHARSSVTQQATVGEAETDRANEVGR